MLSILIPTYHCAIYPLVLELHGQCERTGIEYEIIALDDASSVPPEENTKVNSLANCSYQVLGQNIGRSAIRNLLAQKAKFQWLLFLDADVMPKKTDFIANYLAHISNRQKVVSGGLLYADENPGKTKMLRWVYGKDREAIPADKRSCKPYQSLLASNFLTTKDVMQRVPFNESIPDLRREDTPFSHDLMLQKIPVIHIDNPVYHLGIDEFETALKKEHDALDGLKYLLANKLLRSDYIRISKLYQAILKLRLRPLCRWAHNVASPLMIKNLSGARPSMYLFDLYRIGYLCRNNQ